MDQQSPGAAASLPPWSADDARERVARWQASGLRMTTWCREHGIPLHRLSYWHNRFKRQAAESAGGFVALKPEAAVAPARGHGIVVELPSGVSLRVVTGCDMAVLRAVVETLR